MRASSNTSIRRRFGSLSLIVMPLLLHAACASAESIYWQPHVQIGGGHESNPRLVYEGQNAEASALYQSQVDGELGIESATTRSTLYGRYWYQSLNADHDYDADIAELRGDFTNTTEQSKYTANIDVQYDTTLTSEFEESGRSLNEKKDHRNLQAKLGYQRQLTELDQVSVNASESQARYFDAENTDLNDYDTMEYSATYSRAVSERGSGGLQLTYSEFDIPELPTVWWLGSQSYRTENVIAALFGEYSLTERDSLSLQLGFRSSDFYQEIGSETTKQEGTGRVFSADYKHNFENTRLSVSASRDVRPTSAGRIIEQDSVDVTARYAFGERLAVSLALSADREREPVEQVGSNRDYAQGLLSLIYNVSLQHTMTLEFSDRWQQFRGAEKNDAKSTGVFLRWYWTPQQHTWH